MKIYFIRHGETDWNKERRFQGRTDIPLNEAGRNVALLTQKAMADIPFEAVFTSPLKRARETAELVLGDRGIPIVDDERLIEISFGAGEGSRIDRTIENVEYFFSKPEKYVPAEGGEMLGEVLVRVEDFLRELFGNPSYQDSTVLVSTHGAALSAIMTVIKGNPVEMYWSGGLHRNCGVSIVEIKDGKPEILQEAIVLYEE